MNTPKNMHGPQKFLLLTTEGEIKPFRESEGKSILDHVNELYGEHKPNADEVYVENGPMSLGISFWLSELTIKGDNDLTASNIIATQLAHLLTGNPELTIYGSVIVSGSFESPEHYHGLTDQQIALIDKLLS